MEIKKTSALNSETKRRTRAKAIRAKCLDCCCDYAPAVRNCSIKNCPLWIYRLGYEVDFNDNKVNARSNPEE